MSWQYWCNHADTELTTIVLAVFIFFLLVLVFFRLFPLPLRIKVGFSNWPVAVKINLHATHPFARSALTSILRCPHPLTLWGRVVYFAACLQYQMWQALASVLHMSNVTFDAKDHEQGEVAAVKDAGVRVVAADKESLYFLPDAREVRSRASFFFNIYRNIMLASPARRLDSRVEFAKGVVIAAWQLFRTKFNVGKLLAFSSPSGKSVLTLDETVFTSSVILFS